MILQKLFQEQMLDVVQIGSISARVWCNTLEWPSYLSSRNLAEKQHSYSPYPV